MTENPDQPESAPEGTPTPRVDGLTATFYLRCDDCPQPERCEKMKTIHPDDARTLEREIARLQAQLASLDQKATHSAFRASARITELEELLADLAIRHLVNDSAFRCHHCGVEVQPFKGSIVGPSCDKCRRRFYARPSDD